MAGALNSWTDTAVGAVALVLLLDQLSRNLYRGSPQAFDGDAKAPSVAEAAVECGFDQLIDSDLRFSSICPSNMPKIVRLKSDPWR